MSVIVISIDGDEPLTVAQAARNLRVDEDDNSPPGYEESADIAQLITDARTACENELDVSLVRTTLELRTDRFSSCGVELPRGPVRSIISVKYDDVDGAEQTLAADQYRFTPMTKSCPAMFWSAYGVTFPSARCDHGSVRIRYDAGYPSDDSPEQIVPGNITRAMHLLIAHYYKNREAVDANTLAELPLGVRSLLFPDRQGVGV